jgi:hypothetical protein
MQAAPGLARRRLTIHEPQGLKKIDGKFKDGGHGGPPYRLLLKACGQKKQPRLRVGDGAHYLQGLQGRMSMERPVHHLQEVPFMPGPVFNQGVEA